jgi:hypothetical protein
MVGRRRCRFAVEHPRRRRVRRHRGRKLPINGRAINEVPLAEREKAIEGLGGNASYLSTLLPNPFAGLVPGTVLNNDTVQRGQLLRPYPQFQGITMDRVNEGPPSTMCWSSSSRDGSRAD